jgi:hypothetical protein
LERLRKFTHTHTNLRVVDVPVEIQTEHLPSTSSERYHYASRLLDCSIIFEHPVALIYIKYIKYTMIYAVTYAT